ncbi:hypothetical protein AB0K09_21270 [Streptomyces sp. NPDC049577]|uniref:hypothetical protein n=1 Tax=Streptomyces sp. NPDC049577 TaxID=3155153 RepID=UPI003419662D
MALFRRRPPAARVDPDLGDPRIAALRAAALAGDWPAMSGQLSAVADGEDLSQVLHAAVAETNGVEQWIPQVLAAEPASSLAPLISGVRLIGWGWQARTGARASEVSREQFQVFHERLRVAEERLYEAAERRPDCSAPWYFLQISGRGLQVGQELSRRRFEAAVRRSPGHLGAHQQLLQQLCRKWGGSHEAMHAFARESMLAAPAGSPLGVLVAIAHIEEALDAPERDFSTHLRQPAVVAHLHEAADRSVRHPGGMSPAGINPAVRIQALNTFAMAFALAGERAAARPLFEELGGVVTKSPWIYLSGDPAKAYAVWRAKSGA